MLHVSELKKCFLKDVIVSQSVISIGSGIQVVYVPSSVPVRCLA